MWQRQWETKVSELEHISIETPKWNIDLYVKPKTRKLLHVRKQEKILGLDKDFLNVTKGMIHKKTPEFYENKNVSSLIKVWKDKPQTGRTHLQNMYLIKNL